MLSAVQRFSGVVPAKSSVGTVSRLGGLVDLGKHVVEREETRRNDATKH